MTPPIQINPRDWADVLQILHTHAPGMAVWAFGSRARHTAKPYSDLDLALVTAQPLSLAQLGDLAEAFESSDLTIRVDLVDWASTSAAFRQRIEADRVVVQTGAPE